MGPITEWYEHNHQGLSEMFISNFADALGDVRNMDLKYLFIHLWD